MTDSDKYLSLLRHELFTRVKKFIVLVPMDCTVNVLQSQMEQHTFKCVNNWLNTNIYSYSETSGANVIKPFTAFFIMSNNTGVEKINNI